MTDALRDAFVKLAANRVLAHQTIFKHRHPNVSPYYHREMIQDWHSPLQHLMWRVFRDGGKSTIAEEGICLNAGFREFANCVVIGETFDRASERLQAIKHEIETNELLARLFGDLKGSVWADDEIVLSNNIRILAMGRGQSIRGIKFNEHRPDFFLWDDLESEESVRTPESRLKTRRWAIKEMLPACNPNHKGRMLATMLDPEDLTGELSKPGTGWTTRIYPIEYRGDQGERVPSWPDRYPLSWIDTKKRSFEKLGMLRDYNMEYMCFADSDADKAFRAEMFRVEPQVRTWQAVYAMFDPARTVNANSATTGYAAWSWVANRLVVWDSWAKMLMPDEIVNSVFECDASYRPTIIGVEEDGLNEFLMQPLRHEQAKRGVMLPVRALRAPRGKLDFIRGLQPFFSAREIWFAKEMPDLRQQLLSFPTGRIDAPNALAYALAMRPGAPMYDDFSGRHVAEELHPTTARPAWLCVNATASFVSAALVQSIDGCIRVFADWMREGEPAAVIRDIISEANVEAGQQVRVTCGPTHFDRFNNHGLVQAVIRIPLECRKGLTPERGRDYVRNLLVKELRGMPALLVSSRARWVSNAFAGGYARVLQKQGMLAEYAEEGPYRVLMEGIESFIGLLQLGTAEDDDGAETRYAVNQNGVRYRTALGASAPLTAVKR